MSSSSRSSQSERLHITLLTNDLHSRTVQIPGPEDCRQTHYKNATSGTCFRPPRSGSFHNDRATVSQHRIATHPALLIQAAPPSAGEQPCLDHSVQWKGIFGKETILTGIVGAGLVPVLLRATTRVRPYAPRVCRSLALGHGIAVIRGSACFSRLCSFSARGSQPQEKN